MPLADSRVLCWPLFRVHCYCELASACEELGPDEVEMEEPDEGEEGESTLSYFTEGLVEELEALSGLSYRAGQLGRELLEEIQRMQLNGE